MIKKNNNQNGFTLVEVILYIALVSIFLTGAIQFGWDIIYGQVKSNVQREVNHNLRLASKRILHEVRNAEGINSVSSSSIELAMSDSSRNPTVIDLADGNVRIGFGSSGSCPISSPCNLTSNDVLVTELSFTDLSTGDSSNIRFTIAGEHVNTTGQQAWDYSETYSSSVELRSP